MKFTPTLLAAVSIAISQSAHAEALQLIDAPGPGYRQQTQLQQHLFRQREPVSLNIIAPLSPEFFGRSHRNTFLFNVSPQDSYLSKPIRLFDGPSATPGMIPTRDLKGL
jgi:hypothetical protein